ncbi:MAG: ATP-grasp domain-containing protein [Gammaproteobacteria bacterium]|nr:ATP-grasp domain-containing protein [Gammaproteobacteria bacterium]
MKRLMVANRGEIACRVFQTAAKMGIETVAVYSDADQQAKHVRSADIAVHIGASEANASYLNIEALIQAAQQSGADAIHPGYGFLSESAAFANAVQNAGLLWLGPDADTITQMGDKGAAKALMTSAGVPVVPGADHADPKAAAEAIGYPVLIKAVAGGGGRGMRKVDTPEEFDAALQRAQSEAQSAFGNADVLVEKWIESPRHIEAQILGDGSSVRCIGLRECSIQRRHQKVIEECPPAFLSRKAQAAIEAAAVLAGQSVNYRGAGTVEFVVGADESFYFLEMNTRLQVEHPVTEAVYGIDLVEWQIRIARGHALDQLPALTAQGHAIEARLCAEDEQGIPSVGVITEFTIPNTARVDSAVASGDQVSRYYDSMIAKVIVHRPSRAEAVEALTKVLFDASITGIDTNRRTLMSLLSAPALQAAAIDTRYFEHHSQAHPMPPMLIAAAKWPLAPQSGAWGADGFSNGVGLQHCWQDDQDNLYLLKANGNQRTLSFAEQSIDIVLQGGARFTADGQVHHYQALGCDDGIEALLDGRFYLHRYAPPASLDGGDSHQVLAPITGRVIQVAVECGQQVESGDLLCVMEAMKMEHSVLAAKSGTIASVNVSEGNTVNQSQLIIEWADD